jgi:DNA-directed RNA polymerase subunit RPC12/RpoP
MATIAISCPKCESQIKVPPDLEGKKIRCKECSYVFVVKVSAAAKAAAKAEKPAKKATKEKEAAAPAEDDDDGKAYGMTDQSFLPRCAYCAKEMESEEQVVCLHCGYNHRTRQRIQTEKTMEPTAGEWFIHLLPGILCALVVLSQLASIALYWTWFPKMEAENDSEWWSIGFGLASRIWNTIISLFIIFFAGKFAIKRLILNARPPERKMATRKK